MMTEILKVIIFLFFFPTFLRVEVLVRCLQIVTSRFHLFCKLQVGIKPPFRETARWPQRRPGATATCAAGAASSRSARARSPPALQPMARSLGSTPGTGIRNVSLALLKVRGRVHVQILAISFSSYQPCLKASWSALFYHGLELKVIL